MANRPSLSRELRWGMLLLLIAIALFAFLRFVLLPWWEKPSAEEGLPTAAERQALQAFEEQRRADSLAYVAQRDSAWNARQMAKAKRQARNAAQQAEYEAQRQRWAAEKAMRAVARAERQAHYDSLRKARPEKAKLGTLFDANTADTTQLQRIPGVGRHYSRAIVAYRERLGGFVSTQQITEIEGLPHGIEHWFRLDTHVAVRRIAVNRASFKELLRHPYLNFEQVKAIANRRQKMGPLRSWEELRNCPHFSERDFARLSPYFRFD